MNYQNIVDKIDPKIITPDLSKEELTDLENDISRLINTYPHNTDKSLMRELFRSTISFRGISDKLKCCRRFYSPSKELDEINNAFASDNQEYKRYCDSVKLKEAVDTFTPLEILRAYCDNWILTKKKSKK